MFGLGEIQIVNNQQLSTREQVLRGMESSYNFKLLVDRFLNTLTSDCTKRNYKGSIEYFFMWRYDRMPQTPQELFNVEPVDAITYSEELMDMVADEEIKISTYNYRVLGIKKFYQWLTGLAVSNSNGVKLITESPFSIIKQKSARDKEGSEELSEIEIYQLLNNPFGENDHIKERNMLIVELGIETGIRITALMKTTIKNLVFADGVWCISAIDKGGKLAVKPIEMYYDRLISWYHEDLKTRTFNNGTIFNYHPVSANDMFKRWCTSVGIVNKKVTFHSLRTTTINLVFKKTDGNIGETQKAVNHTHSDTTVGYLDKTKKVNMITNNLLGKIKDGGEYYATLESMSKPQLIEILMSLPLEVKENIMKSWEVNEK